MVLVEDYHVIQAFTPDGSDDAFDIRILPRGTWCNEDLLEIPERNTLWMREIGTGMEPLKSLAQYRGSAKKPLIPLTRPQVDKLVLYLRSLRG